MRFDRLGGRVRRAAVSGCMLVAVCGAGAVAAPAAGADAFTWLGPASLVATGGAGTLPTVGCPSAGQCTAVDHSGEQITFAPVTGAVASRSAVDSIGTVSSVSCPATNQCTGVDNGGNEITFSPTGGQVNAAGRKNIDLGHGLTAVSCASDTSCVAVDDHGQAVAFDPSSGHVDGSVATIDSTTPLTGISCPASTSTCTAVDSGGREITFPVDLSGVGTTTSADIDGATALTAVSCPDATVCTAVDGGGNEVSFAPSSGTVLGTVTQVDINSGTGVPLKSVSCPSTSTCVAVDTLGNEITYAPAATPAASVHSIDGTAYLAAVSCPSGGSGCTAVDNHNTEISFSTSGASSVSHLIVAPALAGISCPTRTQCTAVSAGPSEVTFDPTTGTVNSAGVSSVDTTGNSLTAVSCVTATLCTAVDSGGNEATFDPTTGYVVANGFIAVDTSALRSIDCVTSSSGPQCTAVDGGGNEITFNPQTSAFTNNVGLAPVDNSGSRALQSVSCPAATQCTAVDAGGNEVTFNPQTGVYYTTQQYVSVDRDQHLTSVACPTTTQCTAVDQGGGVITFANPAGPAVPLAPARQTIELSAAHLNSVSCPSASQCTVVDDLGQEATFSPASTTLGPGLLTPIPQANRLQAVSCQSDSICTAVDTAGNGFAGVAPPVDTAPPTIAGTAQEGGQLTESDGSWTNFPTGHSYAWQDCASPTDSNTCSPIGGATGRTYSPTAADVGSYIRVQDTARNAGGAGQPALSAATAQVVPAVPTNGSAPSITSASGLIRQGQPLTERHGAWNEDVPAPISYTYQWESCDTSGNGCTPIAGATAQTYTPTTSDIGHRLVVAESAVNAGGSSAPAASAPAGVVVAAPPPAIQAVTVRATSIKTNAATVRANLVTQGQAVTWQFQYGTSSHYTAATPLQALPAGALPNTATRKLTGLKPNTTYHYRIVETAPATAYLPAATASGRDLTFTTRALGKVVLAAGRLGVSPAGSVTVPLQCKSTVACVMRFFITATTQVGHGAARHSAGVRCGTRFTRLHAGRKLAVTVTMSKACLTLLRTAPHHRLTATFATRPQSGQLGIVRKITLLATTTRHATLRRVGGRS